MKGINLNILKYFPVMPDQASKEAVDYDLLFWFITLIAVFFSVVVIALTFWLATKYRRGSTADRRNPIDHHSKLELWIISVPTSLALFTFAWSALQWIHVRKMPEKAMEVYVVGKQWMWHLQHPDGTRENNEVHIPVDTDIKFTMISQDVIHAFYLPEFRAQFHVVPGRYTDMWIHPTKTGRFRMFCAMHCGTQHSEMVGWVYVMSKADYAKWKTNGGNRFAAMPTTMVEAGRKVWDQKGCGNCHTGMDTVRGPSLTGIYGKPRQLEDGTAVADTDYLRDSIMTPWRRITKGYDPTMPAYQGEIAEEDVLSLVEYIKSGSNMSDGKMLPYSQSARSGKKMGPSSTRSATDLANDSASGPMSQSQQGGSSQN